MSLGVEYGCPYVLEGPDGTRAVFNDDTDEDFVGTLSAESSGLDSADVREDATDATEEDGGVHGNFYYGRRPVVLQGTIIASGPEDRNAKVAKLKAASNAMREDATLTWIPVGGPVVGVELKLRRQQPIRITKGYVKDFLVPMVSASASIASAFLHEEIGFPNLFVSSTALTAGSNSAEDKGGPEPWTNLGNIKLKDNTYVTNLLTAETPTNALKINTPHIGIPEGASVKGVEARLERKGFASTVMCKDTEVKLEKAGIAVGSNKAKTTTWSSTEEFITYGGSTDLWGTTISVADLENSKFGFRVVAGISDTTGVLSVDYGDTIAYLTYPDLVINNIGDALAYPVIEINGPITNPELKNVTSGDTIKLDAQLELGDTRIIDFQARTIVNSSGEYKYNELSFAESEWWTLLPGNNSIRLSGAEANIATNYKVTYRDAWL